MKKSVPLFIFKPRLSPTSLNGKQIFSKAAQKDFGLLVLADLIWRSHFSNSALLSVSATPACRLQGLELFLEFQQNFTVS